VYESLSKSSERRNAPSRELDVSSVCPLGSVVVEIAEVSYSRGRVT
jgi:hypothetical protein